jgi:hypothetical protein
MYAKINEMIQQRLVVFEDGMLIIVRMCVGA